MIIGTKDQSKIINITSDQLTTSQFLNKRTKICLSIF